MGAYALRRLGAGLIVLALVSFIGFMLINAAPGNTLLALLGQGVGSGVSADVMKQYEHDLGLDKPVLERYGKWVGNIVQGDLGKSLATRRPVWGEIQDRIPVSVELILLASVLSLLFAIPLGIYSAAREGSAGDYFSRVFSILGLALPNFWVAILVVIAAAAWFNLSLATFDPPYIWNGFIANIQAYIAPAIILAIGLMATTMRMSRSAALEVLHEDYIRTARAKGLRERVVILRHVVRNAAIPVVTIFGNQFAFLLGGTVVEEQIFRLNGVGRYAFTVINGRDFTAVMGVTLLLAAFVILMNLIVDLSYGFIDPRIRYS